MRSKSTMTAFVLAMALGAPSAVGAAEAPWKMRIPAHAEIGATAVPKAEFEFACRDGKGGAMSLTLILPPPEELRAFPLDDFEGPDGIGEVHKLAEWSVGGAKKPARARTAISGWRGVDGDGFLLSTARESGHPSDLARLAKHLVGSDEAHLRLVVKPPKPGVALKVEAPIAGHREAVAKVLAPCLAAVK